VLVLVEVVFAVVEVLVVLLLMAVLPLLLRSIG
jgi:hypothetical protein